MGAWGPVGRHRRRGVRRRHGVAAVTPPLRCSSAPGCGATGTHSRPTWKTGWV